MIKNLNLRYHILPVQEQGQLQTWFKNVIIKNCIIVVSVQLLKHCAEFIYT